MPATAIVCLPIADRGTSYAFYGAGLGLTTPGERAEDGIPEPLQVDVGGLRVMLIPRGGFGWVVGGREVAEPGRPECLLSLAVDADAEVDAWVARAADAGAEIVAAPTARPWGYVGTFADPDGHLWQVTSTPAPE